jgi:hypothetical protein
LPDFCASAVFSPISYAFILETMAKCFIHGKETEQQLILEIDSDKAISTDSGREHDEDCHCGL